MKHAIALGFALVLVASVCAGQTPATPGPAGVTAPEGRLPIHLRSGETLWTDRPATIAFGVVSYFDPEKQAWKTIPASAVDLDKTRAAQDAARARKVAEASPKITTRDLREPQSAEGPGWSAVGIDPDSLDAEQKAIAERNASRKQPASPEASQARPAGPSLAAKPPGRVNPDGSVTVAAST